MHTVIDMAAAYLFPFFIGFSLLWPLAQFLDPISQVFHQRCLSFAPDSTWKPAYQALVCGAKFPSGPMFNSLKLTTLLHLAVVSGAHLLLLELIVRRIFNHLGINRGLIGVTLFAYCLATNLQAPVVRAFASWGLTGFSKKQKFFWTGPQITLLAGILTWAIFPQWISSYSFLLSWGASLGISLSFSKAKKSFFQSLYKNAAIYLLLFPILAPISPPHPAGILCNWLLAPFIGALLFPLCLLGFVIPGSHLVLDYFWQALSVVIQNVSSVITIVPAYGYVPRIYLWLYLWIVHYFIHFHRISNARKVA